MALPIARQTDRQITVALKDQTVYGVAESGAGAEKFRFNTGGLSLITNTEASNENRDDGQSTRGGHGRRRVEGSYAADLAVGAFNTLDAAVMRSTWSADVTITQATAALSSATISVSAGVIAFSAGSLLTAGVRVGQVIRPTVGLDAADLNQNCIVAAVSAQSLTLVRVDGVALTNVAGPVATYTFVIKKNVIRGTTDYAFTIEEYRQLLDRSELYDSCRVNSKTLVVTPDQKVTTEFAFLGRKKVLLASGSSPNFTSPSTTTSLGLSSARAKLVIGTSAVVGLSGFNFTLNNNGFVPNEVDEFPSEIGMGNATIEASITLLEADLDRVADYLAETQRMIAVIIEEPESAPRDFFALSMTNCTFGGANKSGAGADRFSTRTLPLIVGADDAGGAFDRTMVRFSSSV